MNVKNRTLEKIVELERREWYSCEWGSNTGADRRFPVCTTRMRHEHEQKNEQKERQTKRSERKGERSKSDEGSKIAGTTEGSKGTRLR